MIRFTVAIPTPADVARTLWALFRYISGGRY